MTTLYSEGNHLPYNPLYAEREQMPPNKPLILIVDDELLISALLQILLEDAGFRVEVVHNADDAFAVACQQLPAFMLIDVMMPTGNGDLLVRRLREYDATCHLPMALMSSARPRLTHMEGIPFLPKPFDIEEVVGFVHRHFRQSPD